MNEKYKIDFEKAHTEYKNSKGETVVGVTTALNQLEKYGLHYYYYSKGKNGIDFKTQDPAAAIGTIIHAKIMCYLKGMELDKSNITEDQDRLSDNCLKSFMEYIKDKEIKPLYLEHSLVSDTFNYGGTFDFLGLVNGYIELWDYKSSTDLFDDNYIQGAAYANLVIENKLVDELDKIVLVNIPKTEGSNYKIAMIKPNEPLTNAYFKKFLKCVELCEIENEIKRIKKGGKNGE